MPLDTDFLLQAGLAAAGGIVFLLIGIKTLRSDHHHYEMVRRRTGGARRAAVGTVGHSLSDADADANVVHGIAISRRNGRRVIVRNGKVAQDAITTC